MTTTDHPHVRARLRASSSDRPTRRSPRRAGAERIHRPSVQLISQAVVAGYIHEISQRHRQPSIPVTGASVTSA